MPYSTSMFVSSAAISRVKFNTRMWVHCPNGALTRLDSTRLTPRLRRRHRKSTIGQCLNSSWKSFSSSSQISGTLALGVFISAITSSLASSFRTSFSCILEGILVYLLQLVIKPFCYTLLHFLCEFFIISININQVGVIPVIYGKWKLRTKKTMLNK